MKEQIYAVAAACLAFICICIAVSAQTKTGSALRTEELLVPDAALVVLAVDSKTVLRLHQDGTIDWYGSQDEATRAFWKYVQDVVIQNRAQVVEALELAAEFVEDRNQILPTIDRVTLMATIDLRTPAQRIRAEAEERATKIEREAEAARKIRAALALLKIEADAPKVEQVR